jgi:hypothetical protein
MKVPGADQITQVILVCEQSIPATVPAIDTDSIIPITMWIGETHAVVCEPCLGLEEKCIHQLIYIRRGTQQQLQLGKN